MRIIYNAAIHIRFDRSFSYFLRNYLNENIERNLYLHLNIEENIEVEYINHSQLDWVYDTYEHVSNLIYFRFLV